MRSWNLRKVGGWFVGLGCALLLLVAMITPALAGQPIVLRLGTGDPAGASSTSTTSAKFAELANQKSNGELDVKVFYQSLGTEAGLTEQVVEFLLQRPGVLGSALAGQDAALDEHAQGMWDGIG